VLIVTSSRSQQQQVGHRASFTARALALALVGLFLQGQLASLLHSATVRHVVCSEHGELVDLPAGDAAAGPELAAADAQPALHDGGAPIEAETGHHHCQYLAATRPRALIAAAPVGVASPLHVAATVQLPPRRQLPVVSKLVLLLAPKTSPPVAA
jgi:hypothetical protein